MFRFLFVWLSLTSIAATRIQTDAVTELGAEFGASCDSLQNRFHNQVHTLRVALDARTSESVITQARFAMRMGGLIRTLRRAQECTWVVENNSDDIEEMRSIMQELLAGNPCGDAARTELEAVGSAEGHAQTQAILRASSILMSDDCEASEIQSGDDVQTPEARLEDMEEELQDSIDQIMDAEEGEALIQLETAGRFGRFMRGVGVFFLMIFLAFACVGVAAMIGVALATAVVFLLSGFGTLTPVLGQGLAWQLLLGIFLGAQWGSVFGLVPCAYQLYNSVLPRLSQ